MSSSKERVFVTAASGNIGSGVVRGLIKKGIDTTAYVRDEQKAKDLFKDELNTGHLRFVVGTYSSIDVFTEAIRGHTRLFLLVAAAADSKPASMSQIKGTFGKIAFEQGVRQIVDLSSACVSSYGKKGIIGYMHTAAEEKLWTLADENPEQCSLVMLRPGSFMSNHFMSDVHHIKHSNKIVSCGSPSSTVTWIDTKDISDCAVVVLSESVEKHDRNVYDMGADALSNEQRAAVFSKVLAEVPDVAQESSILAYARKIPVALKNM
ncbi:unnamed protein product [Rotaria sordida]|uniref:NAD(P)-binding domain-containing protein n=1 Tax=Rotaria sordida TaxID=392033 RepID=A0A815EJW0_9BILA|nr:unnamed protein product [Rotaria sordida]